MPFRQEVLNNCISTQNQSLSALRQSERRIKFGWVGHWNRSVLRSIAAYISLRCYDKGKGNNGTFLGEGGGVGKDMWPGAPLCLLCKSNSRQSPMQRIYHHHHLRFPCFGNTLQYFSDTQVFLVSTSLRPCDSLGHWAEFWISISSRLGSLFRTKKCRRVWKVTEGLQVIALWMCHCGKIGPL